MFKKNTKNGKKTKIKFVSRWTLSLCLGSQHTLTYYTKYNKKPESSRGKVIPYLKWDSKVKVIIIKKGEINIQNSLRQSRQQKACNKNIYVNLWKYCNWFERNSYKNWVIKRTGSNDKVVTITVTKSRVKNFDTSKLSWICELTPRNKTGFFRKKMKKKNLKIEIKWAWFWGGEVICNTP